MLLGTTYSEVKSPNNLALYPGSSPAENCFSAGEEPGYEAIYRSMLFSVGCDCFATSSVTVHTFTISKAVGCLHSS